MASVSSFLHYGLSHSWLSLLQTRGRITLVPILALCLSQSPPASLLYQVCTGHHFMRKFSGTPRSRFTWGPTAARAMLLYTSCPELCKGSHTWHSV